MLKIIYTFAKNIIRLCSTRIRVFNMKKIFYLFALVAISLCFVQCETPSNNGDDSNDKLDGHKYVDLGLPSEIKWATCNIGANQPEQYGDYFAWGEVETKTDYTWDTYLYSEDDGETILKYSETDGKTELDPEDDAAAVILGGEWRMPTKTQLEELVNNCTWNWTTKNNVNGYEVVGPNGNSIFLPATGYYTLSDGLMYDGEDGFYWTKSISSVNLYHGSDLYFSSEDVYVGHDYRNFGLPVRPVHP